MDDFPAPIPPAAAGNAFARQLVDEEIPLGWECACPALQIECWSSDRPATAPAAVSDS